MVETFITSIYTVMVSWTYILLTILIIVKIIQFFTGGNLNWPFSGSSGKKKKRGKDKNEKNTISPEDKKKLKEKPVKGLDVNNPGHMQIHVVDEDDNPIQGAQITIKPAHLKKRNIFLIKGKRRKAEWREYKGYTDANGVWPGTGRHEKVGSGTLHLKVYKKGFKNITWWSDKSYYQEKIIDLAPEEKLELEIRLERKGEKGENYEPYIISITPRPDGKMEVKGIVK